jgi:hypothetical protein
VFGPWLHIISNFTSFSDNSLKIDGMGSEEPNNAGESYDVRDEGSRVDRSR